jgi:hypothetical protein
VATWRPSSAVASGRQTDDAMQTLIRKKLVLGYMVHGFRSSFMDWVAEVHPQRLLKAERALDHEIDNQVQRAYLRTDFFEQRRELAELWAGHLTSGIGACKPAIMSSNAELHRVHSGRRLRQTPN